MNKSDLKKELKEYYSNSKDEINIVNVPPMNFLMIGGKGDPNNSKDFTDAIQSLFSVAYTIKFTLKKENEMILGLCHYKGFFGQMT